MRCFFPHIIVKKHGDILLHIPNQIRVQIIHVELPYSDKKLDGRVLGLLPMKCHSENKPFFAHLLQFATGLLPINFCPACNYTKFFGNQRKMDCQCCLFGSEKPFQNTQFHAAFSGWESAREIIRMTGQFFVNICCCHTIYFPFETNWKFVSHLFYIRIVLKRQSVGGAEPDPAGSAPKKISP